MSESMMIGPLGRGLTVLPIAAARFRREVGVLVVKGAPLPPLGQRFIEVLRTAGQSAV